MPFSPEQYAAMQNYLNDVRALLDEVSNYIPAELLDETHRLVDHGEAHTGMAQLAWAISDNRVHVPGSVICRVREYAGDDGLPAHLDQFVL